LKLYAFLTILVNSNLNIQYKANLNTQQEIEQLIHETMITKTEHKVYMKSYQYS